jgi:hypothetical protein
MGNSARAHVFYGYCWTEEVDGDFPDDMDAWAEKTLKERGLVDPWDSHPGGRAPEWVDANQAAINAWSTARKEAVESTGVSWGRHGTYDSGTPYLYVEGTRTVADWGEPQRLPSGEVDEAWSVKLDMFLEHLGVEPPEGENQPGWWVASWWG